MEGKNQYIILCSSTVNVTFMNDQRINGRNNSIVTKLSQKQSREGVPDVNSGISMSHNQNTSGSLLGRFQRQNFTASSLFKLNFFLLYKKKQVKHAIASKLKTQYFTSVSNQITIFTAHKHIVPHRIHATDFITNPVDLRQVFLVKIVEA